ncbi:Ldh family oxidoreductase [Alkalihalobacillus oceani]|uniref:Ldh family oxidoreductase n=1 Tax=Halalkalibacter oceani TaxID=1653776 RepID=UPI00203FE930|nr:Ldh family oxidoreductase [Halalkalibacter oceani]MCM3761852.1 Ldh family oxidoreductase [Halalkalibacter oceani]
MPHYNADHLKVFCQHIFGQLGVDFDNAYKVADALIQADLEGVGSHGISRLTIYAKRMKEERINPNPSVSIVKKADSVLLVDGDNGLGQIVSVRAMEEGIALAKKSGTAAIAVRNSNHFGAASYYCQMASEAGLAALVLTNSPPGIPPWGGTKAFFGTNPIAFGFPTGTEAPVLIDLSTSVVARGKIILAAKQNQAIPKGWAIDECGNETENAKEALNGAVLPVGGAKGYALALAVEVFTGVLSGAAFGPHVHNIYDHSDQKANVGHFFVLFDIEKFMPLNTFNLLMKQLISEIKETPTKAGVDEILYPGERRHREWQRSSKEGIYLSDELEQELIQLGEELGVAFAKK